MNESNEGHWSKEPFVRLDVEGTEVEELRAKGTCGDCRWWNVSESYPIDDEPMILQSECRRHPIYCHRREDQWCGEFELI